LRRFLGVLAVVVALLAGSDVPLRRPTNSGLNQFNNLRAAASALYRKGNLAAAQSKYTELLRSAESDGNRTEQARALWGIGNCLLMRYEFSPALANYSRAEALALELHDYEMTGLIRVAMNDLYQRLGNQHRAEELIRSAVQILPQDSRQIAFALLSLARAEHSSGAYASSEYHFRQAISKAQLSSDTGLLQNLYNQYGRCLILAGEYDRAEELLNHAYLLNKLGRSPFLATTWLNLGILSAARGRFQEARDRITRSIEIGRQGGQVFTEYNAFHRRALAESGLDLLPEALADFDWALQQSRSWRRSISLGDLRSGATDLWLAQIYDGYLSAAMRQFRLHPSPDLLLKMFRLAEEGRYLNLQEQLLSARTFPPEYWTAVAQLRAAELALYRDPTEENREHANQLELKLTRWENTGVGQSPLPRQPRDLVPRSSNTLVLNPSENIENFPSEFSLLRCRKLLTGSELYLSFHLGDKESYLWLLTAKDLSVVLLPPKLELQDRVESFRLALDRGDTNLASSAAELYKILFGNLPPSLASTPNWILSLDGALFDVPFAALRFPLPSGETRFLIERNSLRIVPGIALIDPARKKPELGRFVGVGDPIYNTADARWQSPPRSWFAALPDRAAEPSLARLPGSGREIQACSREWRSRETPTLLLGKAVNRQHLEPLLSSHPAVLHLATHILQPMAQRELAIIAIGLDARGQPDFLTPNEIAVHNYRPGLVVLSGCSSGQGKALPGVGLFGITRAWLLSGAQAVVASHWPTPDESGDLFQNFYRDYPIEQNQISSAAAATALRSAQIAMLRAGSWRANPRYWAGFYVVGKD